MRSILKGVLITSVVIPALAMISIALCSVMSDANEFRNEEWTELQRRNTSIVCWFANMLDGMTNKSDAAQNLPSIQGEQDTGKNGQYC